MIVGGHLGFMDAGGGAVKTFGITGEKGDITTTSDNGATFNKTSSPFSNIACGGLVLVRDGVSVAITNNNKFYTSTDYKTWTDRGSAGFASGYYPYCICHDPDSGVYMMGGGGNGSTVTMRRSTNGTSFSDVTMPSGWDADYSTRRVVFCNGLFFAFGSRGKLATSTDGTSGSWTTRKDIGGGAFKAVFWDGSQFIAAGNDTFDPVMYTSPTGTTWTKATLGSGIYNIERAFWDGSGIVIGCDYVDANNNATIRRATSPTANWSIIYTFPRAYSYCRGFAYDGVGTALITDSDDVIVTVDNFASFTRASSSSQLYQGGDMSFATIEQ